jgi:hypothetical protein
LTVADHDTGLLWEKKTGAAAGACNEAGDPCPGGLVCNFARRCVKDCAEFVAGPPPNTATYDCSDPHDVNNAYAWGTDPIGVGGIGLGYGFGSTEGDFLRRLNGTFDPDTASGCYAGHCDWRLPAISELQGILLGPGAGPGQVATCNDPVPPGTAPVAMPLAAPCIDGGASGDVFHHPGATASSLYWSATPYEDTTVSRWTADFNTGLVEPYFVYDADLDGNVLSPFFGGGDAHTVIGDSLHVRAVRAGSCTD